jgi:hypothetical protein
VRPATHIKDRRTAERGQGRRCFGFCAFGSDLSGIAIADSSRQPAANLRLDERQLLMQPLVVAFGGLAFALGLGQSRRHARDARLEPLAVCDFPIEAAADFRQCVPRGRGILARRRGRDRRLRERPAQRLAEQLDLGVASPKAVAQMALLGFKLRAERCVFFFEPAQPSDVGAVRGADHVGQHVDVAERAPHDGIGRGRMTEDRPIGSRYVAVRERILPILQQFAFIPELRALPDCGLMAADERLVDELAAILRPRRQRHRLLVQRMIVGRCGVRHAELDHDTAQFGGRSRCR